MRRPARKPDELEGGADFPIRIGEAMDVNFSHTLERRAPERGAAALGHDIRDAHAAQLRHQDEG